MFGSGFHHMIAVAFFVLIAVFGISTAAASQGSEELFDQLTEAEKLQVLELIDYASEAYDRGSFQDALDLFNEAYGIFPHPDLLYRIALSHERVGNDELAVQQYRQFLEAVPDAEERGRIESTIAVIEDRLGDSISFLQVVTTPEGAAVYIDDRESAPVGETPTEVTLAPGEYDIFVEKEGYHPLQEEMEVVKGQTVLLRMRMTPLEVAKPARTWWEPVTSAGLAIFGGWAVYRAFGHRDRLREIEAEHRAWHQFHQDNETPRDEEINAQIRRFQEAQNEQAAWAMAMGITGGVALTGSVVLMTWWLLRDDDEELAMGFAPVGDGLVFGVRGGF